MVNIISYGKSKKAILNVTKIAAVVGAVTLSGTSFAKDTTTWIDVSKDPETWLFGKAEELFEGEVNELFNEIVVSNLFSALEDKLDKEVKKKLEALFGGIPLFTFASLLSGGGGPSESQVMTRIILAAINDSEQRIIDAIGANYSDDTRADLRAISGWMEDYVSDDARSIHYDQLPDMYYQSDRIMGRFQLRPETIFDNAHLYILVAGLTLDLHKLYAYELANETVKKVNPDATDDEIEARFNELFDKPLKRVISDVQQFVSQGRLGSIYSWREAFEDSFGEADDVQLSRAIPGSEIPARFYSGSAYFSYTMNGRQVEFPVYKASDCRGFPSRAKYHMYSATGPLPAGFTPPAAFEASCLIESDLLQKVRANADRVISKHKESDEAFEQYFSQGFRPVQELLDQWWQATDLPPRDRTEADLELERLDQGPILITRVNYDYPTNSSCTVRSTGGGRQYEMFRVNCAEGSATVQKHYSSVGAWGCTSVNSVTSGFYVSGTCSDWSLYRY